MKKNSKIRASGKLFRKIFINISLLLAVIFLVGFFGSRNLIKSGTPAPGFTLLSISGKTYKLEEFRGRNVIIYFWATWCGVCKVNIPLLNAVASQFKNDPLLLTVVADTENMDKILTLHKENKVSYPVLLAKGDLLTRYRIRQFPTTYFIDKMGKIALTDSGLLTPVGLYLRSLWLKFQ